MIWSESSGTRAISSSMASRGASIVRVGFAARIPSMLVPPLRKAISPMNCVGPSVEGTMRSPLNGSTTSISPSIT